MTHTPGPWMPEFVGSSSAGPDAVDVYEITAGNGQRRVAEYVRADDAFLIAAAPDLLAALECLLESIDGHRVTIGDCNQAVHAIAKAKGEA